MGRSTRNDSRISLFGNINKHQSIILYIVIQVKHHFWLKEAKGGIYYVIGNGLRLHPDWWVNDPMEGAAAVIAEKSAYINVTNNTR